MLTDIEAAALKGHREMDNAQQPPPELTDDLTVYASLRFLLEAGHAVRRRRSSVGGAKVRFKEDGSPATAIEIDLESKIRQWGRRLAPDATIVGEETGGKLPLEGDALAIDPIDGTWAYLSETESYTTTLALIRDGRTTLGMVSNPVTGEIAYAVATRGSRLIRLSLYGEPDGAYPLPTRQGERSTVLVNLQPGLGAGRHLGPLYSAWNEKKIGMVRSPGGSPAWALVEAARGHFTYVNSWSDRPAEAYDLAAAVLIVREAGGEVMDIHERPVDPLSHAGLFLAGVDPDGLRKVSGLLRAGLGLESS